MAETKKTEAAAAAAPPEAACLTLRQKLVEMRKACPEIVKKQHSDGVSYKYAKIYDVWEKITPIMNELGVDFDVISEQATRHAENGDPVYWITMQTKTRNGDKLMFLYASWTGHISHGNTYHLRQNMDAYFFSYFPELKPSPKGDTTHGPKTEQPRKQVEGQVRQPVRQPDRLDRGR